MLRLIFKCSALPPPEEQVSQAFLRLYYYGIEILTQLISDLHAVRSGILLWSENIVEINKQMFPQYEKYKSIHRQYAKMKPAKQKQFEQRCHAELTLYDAAVRYLENLKAGGEAITPKKWRNEADVLTAQKKLQYQELRAMREEIKAVEKLRKTAEQLGKDTQSKEKKRSEPER